MKKSRKLSVCVVGALLFINTAGAAQETPGPPYPSKPWPTGYDDPFEREPSEVPEAYSANADNITNAPVPPGGCPDCPSVPLDDHIQWLLAGGFMFALWRLRKANSKLPQAKGLTAL